MNKSESGIRTPIRERLHSVSEKSMKFSVVAMFVVAVAGADALAIPSISLLLGSGLVNTVTEPKQS